MRSIRGTRLAAAHCPSPASASESPTARVEIFARHDHLQADASTGESWHSHHNSRHYLIRDECQHERGVRVLSSFRLAGLIIALLAICGPARAQELAPAGRGVSVHKLAID